MDDEMLDSAVNRIVGFMLFAVFAVCFTVLVSVLAIVLWG